NEECKTRKSIRNLFHFLIPFSLFVVHYSIFIIGYWIFYILAKFLPPHPAPVLSWRQTHSFCKILCEIIGVGISKRKGYFLDFMFCMIQKFCGFQNFQMRKITERRITRL